MDKTGVVVQNARAYAVSESGYVFCDYEDPNLRSHGYWSRLDPAGSGHVLLQGDIPHAGFEDCFVRGVAMVGQNVVATGWVRPNHNTFTNDSGFTWALNAPGITTFQIPNATTRSVSVNAMGTVAGSSGPVNGEEGFRMVSGQSPIALVPLPGYGSSMAESLNVSSVTVGTSRNFLGHMRATAWLPGTGAPRALDWLDATAPYAQAQGVNRSHHAAGSSSVPDPLSVNGTGTSPHAVLWSSLAPTDLGVLSWYSGSRGNAISDGIAGALAEEVVGTSWDTHSANSGYLAFMWDATTGMRDLNLALSASYGMTNVTIIEATGINSLGEIAAIGLEYPNIYHAVLLTPDIATPRLGRLQAPFVGAATTMHGIGFTPGVAINLVYDFGIGSTPMLNCTGQSMQVDPANNPLLATAVADQRGRVEFQFVVPTVDFSTGIYFQAYDPAGCDLSNLVLEVVQ